MPLSLFSVPVQAMCCGNVYVYAEDAEAAEALAARHSGDGVAFGPVHDEVTVTNGASGYGELPGLDDPLPDSEVENTVQRWQCDAMTGYHRQRIFEVNTFDERMKHSDLARAYEDRRARLVRDMTRATL